ncbi:261_t:CDS:2, partial [Funneliformis geosporum]
IARGQLPFYKACYIYHPVSENLSDQFKRFYQLISQKYKLYMWQYELMNLKQERDKVKTYTSRFKKLASRVDTRGISDVFKVRIFLNGLNKELATLVAIQNPNTLDATIT